MPKILNPLWLATVSLLFCSRAQSQPAPDWAVEYVLQADNNHNVIYSGGQITFPATSIGSSSTAVLIVSNRGTAAGSLYSVNLSGQAFQVTGRPALPAVLDTGKQLTFAIVFSPASVGTQAGTLSLTFSDGSVFIAKLSGPTAAPSFKVTYYFQNSGNVNSVESGGRITYPVTKINTTTTAIIDVVNFGLGAGAINTVSLTGDDFQLQGLGLLPVYVATGKALQFAVAYSPSTVAASSGTLTIGLDDGQNISISLLGTASGPVYTYAVLKDASKSPVAPGQIITIPDTALGQSTAVTVQFANTGTVVGTVNGIAVSGQGFQLSNLPIFPLTMNPNDSAQFTLTFSPAEPSTANGYLRIGNDVFNLVATATGVKLTYAYTLNAGPASVQSGQPVLFGSTKVGSTSKVTFTVANQGNTSATLSNISIGSSKSSFKLGDLPQVPVTISPAHQISFDVIFSPTTLGDTTAALRLDTATFNLIGTGITPPDLPDITLSGPSGTVATMQQPAVSLDLGAPYPIPLSGSLMLTVDSNTYTADPAVQFATGGRTVGFTIPANSTRAQFPNGDSIRLQTGTVTTKITIVAALTVGALDVTPTTAPSISFNVPASPPQLLTVGVSQPTSSGFTLVVTGLSPTRSLTKLDLTFTPTSAYKLPNAHFTFDIGASAATWYRTAESESYGSLFTLSIPFGFNPGNSVTLGQVFQSIGATAANDLGQSNSVSIQPQ